MSNLRRRWRPLVSASTLASLLALAAPTHAQEPTMQIRLELDDTTLTATLDDTPSTREFLAQLPMERVLQDYAETEKISDLPRRLTTDTRPGPVTWPTTRPGATWRSSTGISAFPAGWCGWAGWTVGWRPCARPGR